MPEFVLPKAGSSMFIGRAREKGAFGGSTLSTEDEDGAAELGGVGPPGTDEGCPDVSMLDTEFTANAQFLK